jgi:acetoin utilization deacetylase AcuC-like enzyme
MLTVYSEDHRLQDGKAELIDGKLLPCFEKPERAEIVIARVREAGLGEVVGPKDFGRAPLQAIHAENFLCFLETAWEQWTAAHGAYDALPLIWPTRGFRQIEPAAIDGKLSYFSLDAGTPITAGTWRAVTASANVALTGGELVADGARAAFSLCRPPGHHARDGGAGRVAILDIDYHHGNGTQTIFYDRDDVLFASLHGHPAQEFPYFLGYEEEIGDGPGAGFNLNYPLHWGAGFELWGAALDRACARIADYGPDVLVVSLGVDTFEGDPISQFRLKSEDYLEVGARIAALGRPTLFVMEGGYAVAEIGVNAVNVLQGFEGG